MWRVEVGGGWWWLLVNGRPLEAHGGIAYSHGEKPSKCVAAEGREDELHILNLRSSVLQPLDRGAQRELTVGSAKTALAFLPTMHSLLASPFCRMPGHPSRPTSLDSFSMQEVD